MQINITIDDSNLELLGNNIIQNMPVAELATMTSSAITKAITDGLVSDHARAFSKLLMKHVDTNYNAYQWVLADDYGFGKIIKMDINGGYGDIAFKMQRAIETVLTSSEMRGVTIHDFLIYIIIREIKHAAKEIVTTAITSDNRVNEATENTLNTLPSLMPEIISSVMTRVMLNTMQSAFIQPSGDAIRALEDSIQQSFMVYNSMHNNPNQHGASPVLTLSADQGYSAEQKSKEKSLFKPKE